MRRAALIRWGSVLLALGLVVIGLRAAWSTYRRTESLWHLTFSREAAAVDGVITEALILDQRETLPPFPLHTYVIRYTFPAPPLGTMLNGQQVVTARVFEQLGGQGSPVTVVFDAQTPTRNAVAPQLAFPAHAGWWGLLTAVAFVGASLVFNIGRVLAAEVTGAPRLIEQDAARN